MLLLLLRADREKVDTRMAILDTIMEIESIVKAVENKQISRSTANGLIRNVLLEVPPHPMTEEGMNS